MPGTVEVRGRLPGVWSLVISVVLSQGNGAHDALDALDGLQLPTRRVLSSASEGAALGFEATHVRLIEQGSLDATVRLLVFGALMFGLATGGSVAAAVSPFPIPVGAAAGAVTLTAATVMYFLWARHGGLDAIRAVDLLNQARLAEAHERWRDPALTTLVNRLVLPTVVARSLKVTHDGRTLSDDDFEALLARESPLLVPELQRHRALATTSTVLSVVAFLPLGAAPLVVGTLNPPLSSNLLISGGAVLLAAGLLAVALLISVEANQVYFDVVERWNRGVLDTARRSLPVRVPEPEPEPSTLEPEPVRVTPPPAPTSDVPRKKLLLPGLVPATP